MEDTTLVAITRKRRKVRSAWISFAGRIAAQLIGAAATVGFGVVVFGSHRAGSATAAAPTAVHASTAASVLVAKPVRTKEGTVLVFVPLERYHDVTDQMVEGVAGAVVTDLSQTGGADANHGVKWAAANAH